MHVKLLLAYDGTHFFGWQKTNTGPSIQEALELALFAITAERVQCEAASRTDRGVHAKGQVVCCKLQTRRDPRRLMRALNAHLPSDITVLSVEEMPPSFHPTLDATGKEYHYFLCNTPVNQPMHRLYSWHIPYSLDLARMQEGAKLFEGEQDFAAFSNLRIDDSIRKIERAQIIPLEGGRLRIELQGNRFLYKMVRNIVGTLIAIGTGKLTLESIPSIFSSRDRTKAGMTAPARGLCLMTVFYGDIR